MICASFAIHNSFKIGTPPHFHTYSETSQGQNPPPGIGFNPQFLPPNTPQDILSPPVFPQPVIPNQTGIYPTVATFMPMPTMSFDSTSTFIDHEINSNIEPLEIPSSSSSSSRSSEVISIQALVGVKGFGNYPIRFLRILFSFKRLYFIIFFRSLFEIREHESFLFNDLFS